MQFFSEFWCWIRDAEGEKRDLEHKQRELEPTYKRIFHDFLRAEIMCENTRDKADCDRMNELQGQVRKIRDQIADVEKKIAELERECG